MATSTPWYSSPTSLARARILRARGQPLGRHRRVDRLGHRNLDHVQRLDHRALVVVALFHRQATGGADDVVVEHTAEDRHEDRAEALLRGLAARERREVFFRDRHALAQRLALGLAVGHVERDAGGEPDATDDRRVVAQRRSRR